MAGLIPFLIVFQVGRIQVAPSMNRIICPAISSYSIQVCCLFPRSPHPAKLPPLESETLQDPGLEAQSPEPYLESQSASTYWLPSNSCGLLSGAVACCFGQIRGPCLERKTVGSYNALFTVSWVTFFLGLGSYDHNKVGYPTKVYVWSAELPRVLK